MMTTGVDYHPSFPEIALFMEETGECGERRLNHDDASPVRNSRIFHHFPITGNSVSDKCRQFSVLGFTRGSLGSSRSATELRPLVVFDSTTD